MTLAAALLAGPVGAAPAASTPDNAPRPRLELPQPAYEVGTREPGATLEIAFPVRNTGAAPLQIEAHPGCGCMVTSADSIIAPGKTGAVKVTLRTAGLRGAVAKHIELVTNDPDNPKAILTIQGHFSEPLRFIPSQQINLPIERGRMAMEEIQIICREPAPLTIEKVESSAPFVRAEVVGTPTRADEAAAANLSMVTLRITTAADAPTQRFTETVTLTTSSPQFRSITLTVKGHPRADRVAPPRVRFDGPAAASGADAARSPAVFRPAPFRGQRMRATRDEVAELVERLSDLKAIDSLGLSAEQLKALLKLLRPAVEQIQEQDLAGADELAKLLPLLRQASNPVLTSPELRRQAEAEYHWLDQINRQAAERMRSQLCLQVLPGIERIITPGQRAAILAAAPRTGPQQRTGAAQLAGARPAAGLNAFVGRVLLTPAAVEVLEAEWMQAQASSDPGGDARSDLAGAHP